MALVTFGTSITIDGQRVECNVPKGTKAYRLANSVFCPLGPSPTRGWFVMTKGALASLSTDGTHTVTWKQVSSDGSSNKTLQFSRLYLLKAERLLPGGLDDTKALYLVELADARYIASLNSATGPIRANLRSYANSANYLTGTSGYTWSSLVSAIWGYCGVLGTYPGLPSGLVVDGVPENTWLIGLNAWRALTAVLDQLDCAVAHNPVAGTYSIVSLGATQSTAEVDNSAIFRSQPITLSNRFASTLKVHFLYNRKNYGQERDTELDGNWAVSGSGDIVDVTTNIPGAIGTKVLWDDLPLLYDEDDLQTNGAQVATRALNRGTRYIARCSVSNNHRIHAGLHNAYLPGGQIRATLWRSWDDGKFNSLGGTVTEFVCSAELVTGFRPEDRGGAVAWLDNQLAAPEREMYAPPDYSRHSFPNYPRLANIVQVHHSSGSAGYTVSANGDGLHLGRVKRWVSGAMDTLDPCWIRFVDTHDTFAGAIDAKQDDYYGPARLTGVITSEGSQLPLYLVRKGGTGDKVPPIYFRNDSSETVPAYGLMRITGGDSTPFFKINKPDTSFNRIYLVNGSTAVASGNFGYGTLLNGHGAAGDQYILYDDSVDTPAVGESWGPSNDSWKLKKWRYGFTIVGGNTGSGATARTMALQGEVNSIRGITSGSIPPDSTGTIKPYDGNGAGTLIHTLTTVTARHMYSSSPIPDATRVQAQWNGGSWDITVAKVC